MKFARARQFLDAVRANDLDAEQQLLDPGVETVTPRGTVRGIAACRQVLQKASGDEQFAMEQAEPEFEEVEGDVVARTREIAHWRPFHAPLRRHSETLSPHRRSVPNAGPHGHASPDTR
jgi:hypothetical protein